MKTFTYFVLISCLFNFQSVWGQVPVQSRQSNASSDIIYQARVPSDEDAAVDRNAPDQVRHISYTANRKAQFTMGDRSVKGEYDAIFQVFEMKCYILQNEKKFGLANQHGEVILPIQYDSLYRSPKTNAGLIVKRNSKYGLINGTGQLILPIIHSEIVAGNPDVTLVKSGKTLQLYANQSGKRLVKSVDYIELYRQAALVKSGSHFGLFTHKEVLPFAYDSLFVPKIDPISQSFSERMKNTQTAFSQVVLRHHEFAHAFGTQKNGKVGLVLANGKTLYEPLYDEVVRANQFGYYAVRKGAYSGVFFSQSPTHATTAVDLDRIGFDGFGAVFLTRDQKTAIFSLTGETLTPFQYDQSVSQYSGIGFRVAQNRKNGFVDMKGQPLVDPLYDYISPLIVGSERFFSVANQQQFGMINQRGETVVPMKYAYVRELNTRFLATREDKTMDLYSLAGQPILPATFTWVGNTATEKSPLQLLRYPDQTYNFLRTDDALLFDENVRAFDYVYDAHGLKDPSSQKGMLAVQSSNGKWGLLNELTQTLDVPMVYDALAQSAELPDGTLVYSAQKGIKYGLLSSANQVLLPFEYDVVDLSLVESYAANSSEWQIVVAKNGKYGTVNATGKVVIPLRYSFLKRIHEQGLFKAKSGKAYQLLSADGSLLTAENFEEISQFEWVGWDEQDRPIARAQAYANGKMHWIDTNGRFQSEPIAQKPHKGITTYDELKTAFVKALDAPTEEPMRQFVEQVAPSAQLLAYLPENIFTHSPLNVSVESIRQKYLRDFLAFKYSVWESYHTKDVIPIYRSALQVNDYSQFNDQYSMVTNFRVSDQRYGGPRLLDNVLHLAVKINGYWISTYFMKRGYTREEE